MDFAFCGKKVFTFGLVTSAMTMACGQQEASQQSQLNHALGEITRSNESWNWIELSEVEFESYVLPVFKPGKSHLASTDRLAERSQYWLDEIDSALRQQYPEKLANIPKPQAKVIVDSSANAFVAPAFVCYNIPMELRGDSGELPAVFFDITRGKISAWIPTTSCIEAKDPSEIHKAVAAHNQRDLPCKIKFDQGSFYPSSECQMDPALETNASAKKLVLPQTANWITIHSGLLPSMDKERAFVGVIAHELGHYYRSHVTAFQDDYNYFYQIGPNNSAERPIADESLKEIGEAVYVASLIFNESQVFHRVAEQVIPSELFLAAGDLAQQYCAAGDCPESCSVVAGAAGSKTFQDAVSYFPFSKVEDEALYKSFENILVHCMSEISFQGQGEKGGLSWENLENAIVNPKWMPFGRRLSPAGQKLVSASLKRLGSTFSKVEHGENLFHVIGVLNNELNNLRDISSRLIGQARTMKLGRYTREQEADEQAVELLTMVGFNGDAAVDTFLALAKGDKDGFLGGKFGEETCKTLWNNNWKDASGAEIFVPIGDYSQVHQSACFRAYNASRELLTHNYPSSLTEPGLSDETWAGVQKHALNTQLADDIAKNSAKIAENSPEVKAFVERIMPFQSCPLYSH
jgi:hypothetical protein